MMDHLPTVPVVSGTRACVTRLLTPVPGQPEVDEEFTRLIDHCLASSRRLRFPRTSSTVDPSKYLRGGISPFPSIQVVPPPEYFEPPFIVEGRSEFERHAKLAAAGEALVFGMINNILLTHGSMLYQDDWRSNLFNLLRIHHPAFANWDQNPELETPDFEFPDDDGVFTKVLIAHGHLDPKQWTGHGPIYIIDVKTSLTNRCEDYFLTRAQHDRMMRNIHPSPIEQERPTIYIIIRVTNMQEQDIKVKIHVDPASKMHLKQIWVASDPESAPEVSPAGAVQPQAVQQQQQQQQPQ